MQEQRYLPPCFAKQNATAHAGAEVFASFLPVQSDSQASEWCSYFENDVLVVFKYLIQIIFYLFHTNKKSLFSGSVHIIKKLFKKIFL